MYRSGYNCGLTFVSIKCLSILLMINGRPINQCFSSLNFLSSKMSSKGLFKWFLEVWSQTVKDKKAFQQKLQDYILNSL